jgi:hypothetical protein
MPSDIVYITSDVGEININSVDPFADARIVVEANNPTDVIRVSETERINIGDVDIISGDVYIQQDNAVEVVKVIERGLQGPRGVPGLPGAGKPFYPIIEGSIYQSTASISIFNELNVTGSVTVANDIITYGRVGVNTSSPSSFFNIISDDGAVDMIVAQSQSVDYFKVDNRGVVVFGEFSYQPTPVAGGVYRDDGNFYVGL